MVLFIMPYKVVVSFEYVVEILKCDHSNEATEQYFPVVLFLKLYNLVTLFRLKLLNSNFLWRWYK